MSAPIFTDHDIAVHHGDARDVLPTMQAESVHCVVTSPPYYGLRDYGVDGQIGLEATPAEYVGTLRSVFAAVRRVLRPDGVLWLNLGDSYASAPPGATPYADRSTTLASKRHSPATAAMRESVRTAAINREKFMPAKNLMGIPWRVAFALQDDGWILRNAVIWHKPNAMPESVTDRLSTRYEHLFLFSKARRYWFDLDAIRERVAYPGDQRHLRGQLAVAGESRIDPATRTSGNGETRNPGDVWTIATEPYPAAHFACMPSRLARRAIAAGCPIGGTVLDPFAGSGTTLMAARQLLRRAIGIELSAEYCAQIQRRIGDPILDFYGPAS